MQDVQKLSTGEVFEENEFQHFIQVTAFQITFALLKQFRN